MAKRPLLSPSPTVGNHMKHTFLFSSIALGLANFSYAADLEHVIVSAARDGILASESGSSVTVIDEEQLALRPNISLADILRSVPGLAVNQTSGLGSQVQLRMRGGEANHVLVFIDGVQANDPAQGDDFNFAHLLNMDIASIEVVRGPQSALWGSDALSGMIYIRSKDGRGGNQFSGYAEGGDGWQSVGANASVGDQDGFIRLNLNSSETDGINVSNFGSEKDGYSNDSAKLAGFYRFNSQFSAGFNTLYVDSDTAFDSLDYDYDYVTYLPLNPDTYGLPVDADNSSVSEQQYTRLYVDFVSVGGDFSVHADASLSDSENHNMSESAWSATGYDDTISSSERRQYTLQGSYKLNSNHQLTTAYEREEQDFNLQSAWLNGDESMDSNAVALQLKGQLSDGIHYLLSSRSDNNSRFKDASTYRASFSWQIQNDMRLRAATGTGIKNPTFTELYGYSSSFKGNPDLQPEESTSWEFGFDVTIADTTEVAVTYFDETLDNEIQTVYDYSDWSSTSVNQDTQSDRNGVEVSADIALSSQIQLGASFTKMTSKEGDLEEIRRPEKMASLYLNWQSQDGSQNIAINLDHNGGMYDTFFGVTSQRMWLGSYNLLSVHASQQLSDNLSVYGRIENGLNEDYEEIYGFNTPQSQAVIGLRVNF